MKRSTMQSLPRRSSLAMRASAVAKLASGKRGDVPDRSEPAGLRLDRFGRKGDRSEQSRAFVESLHSRMIAGRCFGWRRRTSCTRPAWCRSFYRPTAQADQQLLALRQQIRITRCWSTSPCFFATTAPKKRNNASPEPINGARITAQPNGLRCSRSRSTRTTLFSPVSRPFVEEWVFADGSDAQPVTGLLPGASMAAGMRGALNRILEALSIRKR